MIDIDDKLDEKLRQQRDGQLEEDEELQLRFIAKSYAICENSIAVLSNLRTNKSHIYYGMTSDFLGFEPSGSYEKIESIWEEKILNRIHPDDQRRRNLQELVYYQFVSASHSDKAFYWYLENTMRMADKDGKYLPTRHRIFYFKGKGQRGVCYAICLFNLTAKTSKMAILKNSLTGEEHLIDIDEKQLLSEREITIMNLVSQGLSSKAISIRLNISKNTVDRHRQNIIKKMQAANMAEACHKATWNNCRISIRKNMTEFEKMRNSELYDFSNEQGMKSIEHANRLCCRLQTLTLFDEDYRTIIEELIPGIPASATICPPFHCDHGHGIKVGENVFINYGATMLDEGWITIGDRTLIGPNCQLVTPNHPIDYMERRKPVETGFPITIGEDCWLGAGVIVCPGVTIGNRCVIGAGSVVVKDIPDDSMAVGNPARVIRKLR